MTGPALESSPVRIGVVVFRVVLAGLSLAGVITQLVIALQTNFGVVNFFSYFTTLGNLLGSAVFITSAVELARGVHPGGARSAVRGASVVYLAFIGIVFNTLLRGADLGGLRPWVNTVHHLLMPVAVVLDWLIWPPRPRTTVRTTLMWMVFPAAYVCYSLVRGRVTGFYPYPFFNPAAVGGYVGVTTYCTAMLVVFVVLAFLIRFTGNRVSGQTRGAEGTR